MYQKEKINYIEYPLISVIVPIYNMEKYLERCIDSILEQTYTNLEIILVDDCSSDNSPEIIEKYANSDERIKTVRHKENRGLFQARITGSELATGKYIAFVDSDDYISVDWFRKLLRHAEETQSDIVVGEWCYDQEGQNISYINLDHFRIKDYCLEGNEIMDTFMALQGRNFSWTVVWNKLYTTELWNKCYPLFTTFSENHGHMVMWEDIAFSSALWIYAQKVTNVHGIHYYYYKHSKASTSITKNHLRNVKYINDASAAMKFVKDVLITGNIFEKYKDEYEKWKKHNMSIVYKDLVININKKAYKTQILSAFECTEDDYEEENDFFQSITTPINESFDWLEEIKKKIVSVNTKFVSFDVFDTLVQRPFMYPTDLFELLSERLNKKLSAYVNFKSIREHAERTVRQKLSMYNPSKEEITLEEIYQYIKDNYVFCNELIEEIKQWEIELELRYCTQRKIGKELFDLAIENGKKVIICSDMFLPQNAIAQILENNDYHGYYKLYVSCDIGMTKEQKSLYKYVQKELNCINPKNFMHIGDNYYSDVQNSCACGWNSGHLPKASELLFNQNPGIYGGEAFNKIYKKSLFKEDYSLSFNDFTAVRSISAIVANKFFDNPYVSVNPWSDFNADPRMIGYATLGPHLLALCKWIYKIAKREKIGTIHFVARDGYIVKQAFDSFNYPNVKSNYIRLSRKALLLADIEKTEDLYSVFNKINITVSPKKISESLAPIIPDDKLDKLEKIFAANNLNFHRKLKNMIELERCMKVYIEQIIDMNMLPPYKNKLKEYFSQFVSPGDYIFDIGYSGRPEASLSNILGFPVGSIYIHTNSQIAEVRQQKYNCPAETFYQFKPCITGVMREHLLMELGPSTVGYQEIDGKLFPMFEDYNGDYCSTFITKIVQENALEFVRDYLSKFKDYDIMFNFQNEVVSASLEYYLHYSKPIDRQIFATLPFEDDLGEGKTMNAVEFWEREISSRDFTSKTSYVSSGVTGDILPGIYIDGYFIKLCEILNKIFPRGSKRRNILKKGASVFFK